ncbi:MAG: sulfotransferase [Flavobacteriales bacterium]|nr:sulfotransferase [Flavobacteriales bacterium]
MRIVFLLSMPRSGSTLLRLHLDRFPGAISVPETHFFVFQQQYARYDPARDEHRKLIATRWSNLHTIQKFPIDRDALRQRIIDHATRWQDVFTFTLEAYRAAMKPGITDPLWIEKSPPHIFFQPAIRSMFPQARFVYLVRDPRSVIGSLKSMPWSTSNVFALSRSWNKALALSRDAGHHHLVRYEDLVSDPEATFNTLASSFGIEADYAALERLDDRVEKGNWNSANALKPISADMMEKWKQQLSAQDSDLAIIQHVCAEGMHRMGYAFEPEKKDANYRINLWSGMLRFALLRAFGRQV